MPHEKFPYESAEDFLKYIAGWKNNGRLRLDLHLKRDRFYRSVTTRDCEEILTTARASSFLWPPEWDEAHQNYVLRVRGRDLDDKGMELVFTVDFPNATVLIITAKVDTPDSFD